jgi:plastocyanin
MSTKTYIAIAVVVLIVAGGFLFLQSGGTPQAPTGGKQPASLEAMQEQTITYTDSGYSPREITITRGGTVTFKNQSSKEMWPATAIHPTHTIYPGSDIAKCNTPEGKGMFDACGPVALGGSWSFVFNEVGTWGFHDHLNVSSTGRIAVE